jgi:Tfp pilus assembly protein PilO
VKARVESLPPRALIGISVAAVLVYALVLWFLIVSPKRAEATTLSDDVVAAELRLAQVRLEATRPAPVTGPKVGDVLTLARAMPTSAEQTGLLLELELLGRATGVTIGSITPREPVASEGGPTAIPVVVTVEGSYRQVSRFVKRARDLVRFRNGRVRATGRLFGVQAVELTESSAKGFPTLDATITLNAYVYDGPIVPVAPPQPAAEDETDSAEGATAARSTS